MKVAQYENTDYEPFLPPTRASLLPMSRFILIGLIFTSVFSLWSVNCRLILGWIAQYWRTYAGGSSNKKVTQPLVGKLKLKPSMGQETMKNYYQTFNDYYIGRDVVLFLKNNCILICVVIIDPKNMTTTATFDSALVLSSFNWLAETDYYLCQMQTFSTPTLSKSFSQELGNVRELISLQPVNQQT